MMVIRMEAGTWSREIEIPPDRPTGSVIRLNLSGKRLPELKSVRLLVLVDTRSRLDQLLGLKGPVWWEQIPCNVVDGMIQFIVPEVVD